MEDLLEILRNASQLQEELKSFRQTHLEEIDQLFFGITPLPKQISSSVTPQQTKKRPKRLTSLAEDEDDDTSVATVDASQRQSARMSNSQLLAVAQEEEDEINTTGALMPPPPAPVADETSISSSRPQRAAKLRSEKNLKEPTLNSKLRRPSNDEIVKIKLESEQRASQAHIQSKAITTQAVSAGSDTPVEQPKQTDESTKTTGLRVMVKRERMSSDSTATTTATMEATKSTLTDETAVFSTTAINNTTAANNTTAESNTTAAPAKKGRKKKENHKPIKVERFSDLDKNLPVSSRTRQGSSCTRNSQESQVPPRRSIYEDAVEGLPSAGVGQVAVNETATVLPTVPNGETTFNIPTGNATVTLSDHMAANATFQVETGGGDDDKEDSMKTARQGSMPKAGQENSLMTDDESVVDVVTKPPASKQPAPPKVTTSIKSKMQTRTHELFNPLLQSPVKMRVEAFENAANSQTNLRSKRVKELGTNGSSTTPVIGKLPAPALGRFLTPTQSASAVALNSAVPKKAPMSASKATVLTKSSSGTNLKSTNSSSSKTLTRENSGDDFRKGLHQLAEERKKQREQKHLQAAQQREARERERAERLAKVAEEKRLKKEKLEERKRLELEELQRKIYQQEEAERLKKAKAKEQEREMLLKIQQQNSAKAKQHMMPPPPKSKYTFEMLHEDDSTDDEGKVSHKRPPVPNWSRSHVRGLAIVMQSHCPTDVIDSFFSVAPTTPDLKQIFPNIDPSHLKRNSSVLWSTPPRYSELPKY
ncbi:hypothetical protein ACLKA6_015254 [Drosophila palustris]